MKKILIIFYFLIFYLTYTNAQIYYHDYIFMTENNEPWVINDTLLISTEANWILDNQYNTYLPSVIYQNNDDTFRIFNDQLAFFPIQKNNQILNFDYECSIGTTDSLGFYINPCDTLIGYFDLTIYSKKWGNVLDTLNRKIFYVSDSARYDDTIRVLIIGNSLTASGGNIFDIILDTIQNKNLKFYGKKGISPYFHEGNSGWTYSQYIDSTATRVSPFWFNGGLDITSYRDVVNCPEPFDIVIIMLGINDLFGYHRDTSYSSIVLTQSIELVNAFKEDTAANIILVTNTSSENTGDGFYANYGYDENNSIQNFFIEKTHYNRKKFINFYDNKNFNDSVYVISILNLNRNDGYPKINGIHSNGVHPNDLGYSQIGLSYANFVEYIYKNNYIPDTAAYFTSSLGIDYWNSLSRPRSHNIETDGNSMTISGSSGSGNYILKSGVTSGTYIVSFYAKASSNFITQFLGVYSGSYITPITNPIPSSTYYQYYEFRGTLNGDVYIFFAGNSASFNGKSVTIKNIQFQKID